MNSSRSRKILQMVTSYDKHFLDIPKYETTKGTSYEEQCVAISMKWQLVGDKELDEPILDDTEFGPEAQNSDGQSNQQDITSEEVSSGTEYIPDTSSNDEMEETENESFGISTCPSITPNQECKVSSGK